MIGIGDSLPEMELIIATDDGPAKMNTSEIFGGKKVVLFGLPGAFSGTCSLEHLPGFVENAEAIKSKGVDTIALVAVNDHNVLKAWAEQSRAMGKILVISDWDGAFIKAIDMEFDMSAGGMGVRSKRFSAIVEDSTVSSLNVEDTPGTAVTSGAARILEQL